MEGAAKKEDQVPPWRIPEWFPGLGETELSKLKTFNDELLRFNKSLSLISYSTVLKADLVHIADSILGWQMIAKHFSGSEIYDIGSGNGCPGIMIAILSPETRVYLVESDIRKSEYLKHIKDVCELSNVEVLNRRLDKLAEKSVETAVLRGFASISKSLLMLRKFLKPHGQIFQFKGPEWSSEVASLPQQLCSTWNNEHIGDYALPDEKTHHTIVKSSLI